MMEWAGQVSAREKRNSYSLMMGKREGKRTIRK
jgi:hypothetical protein